MKREENWSGNHVFVASCIHRPENIDAARRLVGGARRVRALGTRHSFNGIADSEGGALIDLGAVPPLFEIDPGRRTVTVGAATPYGDLAVHLQDAGWALHNLGSLPHISVAGATATGTHGSGDTNGTLSSAVCGLELITAEGDILRVRRGDPGFDGMVVGLGAFGIVTRVTLDIQPSYSVRQDAFVDLPWETVFENYQAVSSAAYSVSLMTKWSGPKVDRMWLKTRLTEGLPEELAVSHLGAIPAPMHKVSSGRDDANDRLNPFGGVAGPWSDRLAHFRRDRNPGVSDQIQSEYMVPRAKFPEAVRAVHAIGARIDEQLLATEIRTMAADDLWLSGAYGHDAVAIHFTWSRAPEAVDALTREIEALLIPLGGRPHWGKLMHAPAATLAPLYPRLDDFRMLAKQHDPKGKFRNAFMAKHVFGD